MGIAIPQLAPASLDRTSGAQVIDGSLKFETSKTQYLKRTPSGAGDTKAWTFSCWIKRDSLAATHYIFRTPSVDEGFYISASDDKIDVYRYSGSFTYLAKTQQALRDAASGWYHIVYVHNSTAAGGSRLKIYINNVLHSLSITTDISYNTGYSFNTAVEHRIGEINGRMSQAYFIDGYALDPEQFGFTDPLTNTWKPKKYDTNLGTKINAGIVWSDSWDGTGSTGTVDNPTRAFNGDLSNYTSNQNSGTICNWVPSSPITVKRSLRVYASAISSGNNQVFVNGTSIGTVTGTAQWYSIQATELTSIGLQDIGSTHGYLHAVEVDGVILVDSSTSNSTDATYPFGTNGFYLPFDGNSPIGKDQSGNGNDWTPVNFGGSMELDNPNISGARPILNTTQGGAQAAPGVFGSKQNVGYAVTVYNDGGGNKYYIDGVKQDTLTGLIRGATYTFDTSDSTVSSHPFRFSATSNGSHGGGSEYVDGVAAITGAATTITVPHDAPNTLYYYCTSHSGMGADITGITTNEKLADQYASHCVLALPLINLNDDVSASIACTMTKKAVTSNGNAAGSGGQSNFYTRSFYFNASGDKLTVPNSSGDFDFGSGDFTIESYVYIDGEYQGDAIINLYNYTNNRRAWNYYFQGNDDGFEFLISTDGSSQIKRLDSDVPIQKNKWVHVAVTKASNVYRMFFDGIQVDSATVSETIYGTGTTSDSVGIGDYAHTNAEPFNGYLSDIRIYKGVAKYTSNFVVPATFPNVLPDTPSGVSGGSKLTKITDGAVAFDGSGDSLSLAYNADWTLGTTWTIEAFIYLNAISNSYSVIASQHTGSSGGNIWFFAVSGTSNGTVSYRKGLEWYSSGGQINSSGNPVIDVNRWYHVAISSNSGTATMYVDGKSVGSGSVGTFPTASNSLYIGHNSQSGNELQGHISNLRIVKGTAIYTSDFAPPTAPLTNVTNTKLLCCQSNSSAANYAVSPGTITVNGNAAATNFNPFNTDINTVRGQETGYPTWNPLDQGSGVTLSNGSLRASVNGSTNCGVRATTVMPTSGKYFFAIEMNVIDNAADAFAGLMYMRQNDTVRDLTAAGTRLVVRGSGAILNDSTSITGVSFTSEGFNELGVAVDCDANTVQFYVNGVASASAQTPSVPITQDWAPYCGCSSGTSVYTINTGQKPFRFPPPDGFLPLNAANTRPVKVISRPDQYVGVTTYNGNSSSSNFVTDLNFNSKPDFVWIKSRSGSSSPETQNHYLVDSVRGANGSVTKKLYSNSTGEENAGQNDANNGVRFVRNGFELTSNNDGTNDANAYVAWCWKAGGDKNTFNVDGVGYASAAAAPRMTTDSGINSDATACSVGTKQGFSILKYNGTGSNRVLAHGLTQAPEFCLFKRTNGDKYWLIAFPGTTQNSQAMADASNYLKFDATTGGSVGGGQWLYTQSDRLILENSSQGHNVSGGEYVAYCWHSVPGLQKFGRYTGSGSSGKFIELGFRPALLMIKSTAAYGWAIVDTTRSDYNVKVASLYPNKTDAEYTGSGHEIDYLSNGFNLRNSNDRFNKSSTTYIYAAWAEAPSIDLYGGGANAR